MHIKRMAQCFIVLVFGFVALGPPIGSYIVARWIGYPTDDSIMIIVIVFGYGFGFVPALFSSIIDWMILLRLDREKKELQFIIAIIVGSVSGVVSGVIFFPVVWAVGLHAFIENPAKYLSVFVLSGLVCGVFNKVAWRRLVI
ncbi:hypothetical protein EZI54_21660 [Marinobacter halodurans]|uniref:Uncharacterized protein n=1 Tax=Marinobacter halodurans TaxID=2528979 RepID=A0ABY1ZI10_9GAMM|nr:hypothetical protein [Marinobacter halodurans]TBW48117.1 hypothetical protein EZI54_21660 [Marinobacter halodurans]